FFSSRRRHTRSYGDWSSDVCSSDLEMDLTIRAYPTFERLREYCYRVAGTVGLTCTHVFGFHDPRALDLAEKLGLAFQLTNIIRRSEERRVGKECRLRGWRDLWKRRE